MGRPKLQERHGVRNGTPRGEGFGGHPTGSAGAGGKVGAMPWKSRCGWGPTDLWRHAIQFSNLGGSKALKGQVSMK